MRFQPVLNAIKGFSWSYYPYYRFVPSRYCEQSNEVLESLTVHIMLENLLLVFYASLSTFSSNDFVTTPRCLNERAKTIISSEIFSAQNRGYAVDLGFTATLTDNYFMDGNMNWTDSASSLYWDEDWVHYNCYAFAIPRHDLTPDYYPVDHDIYPLHTKWYEPGQFSQNLYFDETTTIRDIAERVVEDFEVLGFENVSTFRLNGVPELKENEELIAMRYTPGDTHFMRYCKLDGHWYHKPSDNAVLRYKYELSESREWPSEMIYPCWTRRDNYSYTGEIWLVKYTPKVFKIALSETIYEPIYLDNFGDRVFAVDVETAGLLNMSFSNVNGFTAVLYTSDWDVVGACSYDSLSAHVDCGRYYLVMKNYRYSDYVYLSASLSHENIREQYNSTEKQFIFNDGDSIVRAVFDGKSLAVTYIPIYSDGEQE